MKRTYLLLILLFSLKAFSQTFSITHNSIVRSYIVHTSPGYSISNQYPLVINMHGLTSTAAQQETYSQMDAVADTGNFIVVYPDGVNNAWNAGFGTNPTVDNVGFISAMIDKVKIDFSINAQKIYACGLSNGGFMSFRLACELHDKIAAIAPVSGLMSDSTRLFCQNSCPVPVMYFHGTADGVVNYNGALGYVSADSTIKIWRAKDGCPVTPVVTNMPDVNPADGCTATKYVYSPGQNFSEVVFFKITNGGHTWPGGFPVPSLGNTNLDIKASGEIWKFFRKHSLQCTSNVVSETSITEQLSVFPNPSNGEFKICGLSQIGAGTRVKLSVFNALGERIYDDPLHTYTNGESILLPLGLGQGIYFLKVESSNGIFTQKIVKQ